MHIIYFCVHSRSFLSRGYVRMNTIIDVSGAQTEEDKTNKRNEAKKRTITEKTEEIGRAHV